MRHPPRLGALGGRVAAVRAALGGAPPVPVGRRAQDGGQDEAVVRGALELALRAGEAMLSLGSAAADVATAIAGITRSFGLRDCQVDVTFTAITVSYDRGEQSIPLTLMRVVTSRTDDYGRLGQVVTLVRDVVEAPPGSAVDAADRAGVLRHLNRAHDRLDTILTAPQPYRRWVVTLLLSTMAAAVAVLLGGGPGVAVVAGLTTTAIDRAGWRLTRWGLPAFFRQAAGAAIATMVAVVLWLAVPHLPVELADFPPSIVVASGIVVLLAGLSLVGSAEDAISGFPVTASGRAFEVVVLTLGIVAGIGGVLDVARRAGVPLEVIAAPVNASPLPVQALSAAVVAAAWGLACYARPRAVLVAAVTAGLAWLLFVLVGQLGAGTALASGMAALLAGFLGELLGPRWHVPPIVVSICAIVPLLPGLAIYRALFQLVNEPVASGGLVRGASGLVGAATVGLALAAGVTLGELLGGRISRRRAA